MNEEQNLVAVAVHIGRLCTTYGLSEEEKAALCLGIAVGAISSMGKLGRLVVQLQAVTDALSPLSRPLVEPGPQVDKFALAAELAAAAVLDEQPAADEQPEASTWEPPTVEPAPAPQQLDKFALAADLAAAAAAAAAAPAPMFEPAAAVMAASAAAAPLLDASPPTVAPTEPPPPVDEQPAVTSTDEQQ